MVQAALVINWAAVPSSSSQLLNLKPWEHRMYFACLSAGRVRPVTWQLVGEDPGY